MVQFNDNYKYAVVYIKDGFDTLLSFNDFFKASKFMRQTCPKVADKGTTICLCHKSTTDGNWELWDTFTPSIRKPCVFNIQRKNRLL